MFFFSQNSVFAGSAKVGGCIVTFKTKGEPVLVSVEGKSENPCTGTWIVEGNDTKKSVISMDLQKLDTGISLRNKHLRETYLQTDKFPTATLTEIDATDIATPGASKPFKGQLELHGKKSPISGTYELKGNQITADFQLDLPEFGVERPAFMGVKIVDKVSVTVKFTAE